MPEKTGTALFYANQVFPGHIRVCPVNGLGKLPAGKPSLLHTHITQPVSKADEQQLVKEIAGYLTDRIDGAVYSYFSGSLQQGIATVIWQLTCCRLNRGKNGAPVEVVFFTYDLEHLGEIKNRLYAVLEQDSFFKQHLEKAATLTKKEKEIIGFLAQGMNSKDIAGHTYTSVHTVNTHRQHIHEKLGINNIHSLLQFADAFDLTGKR